MVLYAWAVRAGLPPDALGEPLAQRRSWSLLKLSVPAAIATVVMMVRLRPLRPAPSGMLDEGDRPARPSTAPRTPTSSRRSSSRSRRAWRSARPRRRSSGSRSAASSRTRRRAGAGRACASGSSSSASSGSARASSSRTSIVHFIVELGRGAARDDLPDAHHGHRDARHRGRDDPERGPLRRGQHAVRRRRAVPR